MTIIISGTNPTGRSVYGGPNEPFADVQIANTDSATETITITQANLIHTDPNAADDTLIAAPPGTFGLVPTLREGSLYPTGTYDAATGTYVLTGRVDATQIPTSTPVIILGPQLGVYPLADGISALTFNPPAVTLAGHETLETKFSISVTDPTGASAAAPDAETLTVTPDVVYRFFDRSNGTHFFTADRSERDALAVTRPDLELETNDFASVNPASFAAETVYRFFDTAHGTEFLTANTAERDTVQATRPDLVFEVNSSFAERSSAAPGDVAVYRMFDTRLGTHFYTGSAGEYAGLTQPGSTAYRADLSPEGIAFYAPSGTFM